MTIDQFALLDDRYRLDEQIGTGGMADVYRGTDQLLDREVAVKVLREVHEPTQRTRFVDEARTLAGLNHPGLITLLDAGILGERPYLVMTLADNKTLSSRIAAGPVPPEDVAAIGVQVAGALAYAHDQGVVHRDVKPSNVMLCGDGRALLGDFGIARLVGSTEHHTATGDAIGSPAYLAPEQVTGSELTPAVDVYALGLVLLEALTGRRAFPGTPVEAAIARLSTEPPIPADLPLGWRDLLLRMTHREPEGRPSAAEVADELLTVGAEVVGLDELEATGPFQPFDAPASEPGPAEHTAVLSAVMAEPLVHAPGAAEQDAVIPEHPAHGRRFWAYVAGAVLLVVAVITVLVLAGGGSEEPKNSDPGVPSGVPTKFQKLLTDLHDAVNGPAE